MLPQIKRPQRSDDGDVEIEVVDVRNVDGSEISDDDPTMLAKNTLFPKGGAKNGTSSRPPASAAAKSNVSLDNLTNKRPSKRAEAFGDEPTRLMPSKHGGKSPVLSGSPISVPPPVASARAQSSRPPAASPSVRPGALPPASSPPPAMDTRQVAPLPNSSLVKGTAGEFRPPAVSPSRRPSPPPAFRDREESHTMLRPLGVLSENAHNDAKASLAVPSAGAIKAQVDAARAKRLADQKARAAETLEVTPVSISERFVVQGRPAAPWAFAFVAMGIFAGLATAVFTGGHASSIAAFIDPARLGIAAAAAQPAAPPAQPAADPAMNISTTTPAPAAVDPALDLAPTTPTTVFAVGRATAKTPDTTAAPTPVAHAAPKAETSKPTPVAKADPPASKPDPAPVAKADPKPAPVADKSSDSSSHGSKSSKGKHAGGGDVDSAAAADALAKAQLENSL